ncbi:Zinc finger protein 862 [Nymphon striatum]|nr:Zinc finger protein 862 [Nymphon striatum]
MRTRLHKFLPCVPELRKCPKAKGILKHFKNFKFVGVLHYLNDVLGVLRKLSLKLQEDKVYFATISSLIDLTVGQLGALRLNGGGEIFKRFLENLNETEGKIVFNGTELSYVDRDVHIENVELHYCSGETSYIEPGKLNLEWPVLHSLLLGSYRKLNPMQVCKAIIFKHAEDLPVFAKLSEAALCICVTSVACERGFSLQNKLKTKARSSLSSESLEKLMKICVGPETSSFPFVSAVQHWNKCKRRRYGSLIKSKKPRLN